VKRLRRVTKLPVALGFGISTAAQFAEVGSFADAVVVGSAIVETIEQNRGREAMAVGAFVRELRAISSQPSAKSNPHFSQRAREMGHPSPLCRVDRESFACGEEQQVPRCARNDKEFLCM